MSVLPKQLILGSLYDILYRAVNMYGIIFIVAAELMFASACIQNVAVLLAVIVVYIKYHNM